MFGKLSFNKSSNSQQKYPTQTQRKPNDPSQSNLNKTKFIKKDNKAPVKQKISFFGKQKLKIDSLSYDLKGSKFRLLNEILYTSTSKQAVQHFKKYKQDFQTYHQGYRKQSAKWQVKPVDHIIQFLLKNNKRYRNKSFIDLGCGDGFIEQQLGKKFNVQSYDLVSNKPFVKVADIANLPVAQNSKDVAIFCLSLMGINYIDFIIEAKRVLKSDGQMIIAEVDSRSSNWGDFCKMVQSIGFKLVKDKQVGYFRKLIFKVYQQNKNKNPKIKGKQVTNIKQASKQLLTPCLYKKR